MADEGFVYRENCFSPVFLGDLDCDNVRVDIAGIC